MKTILYGIPNCDTVKKARTWLAGQDQDFAFHDFKKQGLERAGTFSVGFSEAQYRTLFQSAAP